MPAPRLDNQLCYALYAASSRITAVYRSLLAPMGLTYTQFVVLMALWERDGISISELAARTGISKATLTPLLRRLSEKKLIELIREPHNERQKRVTLTPAAKQLSTQGMAAANAALKATGLKKKQARKLMELCRLLTQVPEADSTLAGW